MLRGAVSYCRRRTKQQSVFAVDILDWILKVILESGVRQCNWSQTELGSNIVVKLGEQCVNERRLIVDSVSIFE